MGFTTPYPCDRGDGTRGYHNFVANNNGVICCTFCGATPNTYSATKTYGATAYHNG